MIKQKTVTIITHRALPPCHKQFLSANTLYVSNCKRVRNAMSEMIGLVVIPLNLPAPQEA